MWSFRAALDDLADEPGEAGDATRRPSGQARSFRYGASSTNVSATITESPHDIPCWAPHSRVRQIYAEEDPAGPTSGIASGVSADSGIEEIRRAIGRQPGPSREQLLRIRRDFAAQHHPDRAPSHLKDSAADAMAVANALIDGALRVLPR
ncbi:MAG: hypothetical protein ACFCUR_20165 [Rhodomicrobiaceae bacterium]